MATIAVIGGGIIGLGSAMMLARERHEVTVFERDAEPVPESPEAAWRRWERQGVAQFRQPHYLHSAARQVLDSHLPEVKDALLDAGCVRFDLLSLMPPSITDRAAREGDDRFQTVTGRRPTIEYAFASTAEKMVTVSRGETVTELLTGEPRAKGVPHVVGIRLADGREFHTDLVIDAMGRRSKLSDWLTAIGARPPIEDAERSGFVYYTRYFHGRGGVPQYRSGLLTHFHSFSLLTLPGDSDTWSMTVFIYSGDQALKMLRYPERWEAVVAACPTHAQWLEGEPVSEIIPMAGVTDRFLRFVVDGAPVATGILSVGDSTACTNPVGGRGISMGLMHAAGTVEAIGRYLDDPVGLAVAHDEMTHARLAPWFRSTVSFDRKRNAQIAATISGRPLAAPDVEDRLAAAMMHDPDLLRASYEITSLLTPPDEVLARPGMVALIDRVYEERGAVALPAPSREQLLSLVT